eukprot:CAMPEP_0174750304 /NCGR_PEP_ID=MMETSP1094-20130205/97430_1 /TAXON_ID=156173 /ORGANISM="Chrysochromulina brevifilum, Strain UTEX LB 985" /LENGTH=358 /DNA_ID=CAMNT_0015955631 /DNA_START=69 /DNA_END=1142 /DNA_ORIENTATION=+
MAAWVPLALDGSAASLGTLGRWLTEPSDIITAPSEAAVSSSDALVHCFPRNWPAVFKQNATLKALVNGQLHGVRCRAIAVPPAGPDASIGKAVAVSLAPFHSFSNAERITVALPEWKIVKGFAVFEVLSETAGSSFVAIRHWWNVSPSGAWLDLSPSLVPSCTAGKILLVESRHGEKPESPLRGSGQAFAISLAQRFAGHAAVDVDLPKVHNVEANAEQPASKLEDPTDPEVIRSGAPPPPVLGDAPLPPPLLPVEQATSTGHETIDKPAPTGHHTVDADGTAAACRMLSQGEAGAANAHDSSDAAGEGRPAGQESPVVSAVEQEEGEAGYSDALAALEARQVLNLSSHSPPPAQCHL